MLEYLLLRSDQVVSRTELLEHVWNMKFDPGSNVVDAHVARLRQKLRGVINTPEIRTVRGIGCRDGAARAVRHRAAPGGDAARRDRHGRTDAVAGAAAPRRAAGRGGEALTNARDA